MHIPRNMNLLSLVILCVLLPFSSHAGAWLQPQGEWQTITTALYYRTDSFYDNDRDRQPQERFSKWQLNPYGEYGFTPNVTLGFNTFVDYVSGENPDLAGDRNHNAGLADSELFARLRLWERDSAIISIQPLVKLPSLYASDSLPRSGSEDFDGELRLMGGYGFAAAGHNHYLSAEAAYRKRFGGPADQFRVDVTLGLRPAENWLILPQIFTTWRVNAPSGAAFTQSGQDDYDLVKAQLSAVYEFSDNMGIQLGGFSHVRARNTGAGGGGLLALWKRF